MTVCTGDLVRRCTAGGRGGWIVSDLRDSTDTIAAPPDGHAPWTELLQLKDRVVVIRSNKSLKYQNTWVGKLAALELQSPELQQVLSDRLLSLPQSSDRGGGVMTALPKNLDAGDGLTIDRDLAIEATRHILIAMKLLLEVPILQSEVHLNLVDRHVAEMLGGDHWRPIARQLVNAVLPQEAS